MRAHRWLVFGLGLSLGCADSATGDALQPDCGDGVAQGSELCDGPDLRDQDCTTINRGYTGGVLGCTETCGNWDDSGCNALPVCGNDAREGTEACDGDDLDGETCVSQGFTGGVLACNTPCSGFSFDGCAGVGPLCGDNVREAIEICDGLDLDGQDCVSQGFVGGTLACNGTCSGFLFSGCLGATSVCGNNKAEGVEACDGTDLEAHTCATQGFASGTLACMGDCSDFDASACQTSIAVCGDEIREGDEACDGTDLDGTTCATEGFSGGSLGCNGTCTALVTIDCYDASCGNGTAEPSEQCDGGDLGGEECTTLGLGFTGGTLACDGACELSLGGCTGSTEACGNDIIEGFETCDGTDLGGATCLSLGYAGGTLDCEGGCNSFDATLCLDETLPELSFCDGGTPLCEAGLDCAGLGTTGVGVCTRDCSGNPGACDPAQFCDTQSSFFDHTGGEDVCWPVADLDEPCLNGAAATACNAPATACLPSGSTGASECKETCAGTAVGTGGGCTTGTCLADRSGFFEGFETSNTCTTDANCTGAGERCTQLNPGTGPELLCARRAGRCGTVVPLVTDISAGFDAALALTDMCNTWGRSQYCAELTSGTAELECVAFRAGFAILVGGERVGCGSDAECAFFGTACINDGISDVCGFSSSGCVAFCETGGGAALTCPTGLTCDVPDQNVQYVGEPDGAGGILDCPVGNECDTGASFSCVDFGGTSFCVRPRRVCRL